MQEPANASTADGPFYRAADFFLLRSPVLPVQEFLRITGAPLTDGLDERRAHGRQLLRQAARRPRVAQALHIASSSVTAGLERLADAPPQDRRSRRAYSTLLRYLTRMSTRSTPYGLFAGVAVGRFTRAPGAAGVLSLAADPVGATRTRADLGWLLALLKEIEGDPAVRARLGVRVNSAVYRVGGRGVLPGADLYGEQDNRLAGFRFTEPAELAIALAREPGTTYEDILDRIATGITGATRDKAQSFLAQLWDLHVLTSDLRPSLVEPHPERALAKQLTGLEAAVPVLETLREAGALTERVDAEPGAAPVALLDELTRIRRTLVPGYTKETFQLDTRLAVASAGSLPDGVGEAAADAAEALQRMGSFPARPQHIAEYHSAFLERFGVDSEIPLLQLLSPETGLDAPNSYSNPARPFPLPPVGEDRAPGKELRLAALLSETLRSGAHTLEITDERLAQLSVWRAGQHEPRVRPSIDLYGQLAADSPQAVCEGDWRLVLAPAGMAEGGRTFGRFHDLFDGQTLDRLKDYARAEEALCPDVVFADLNYQHPHARSANVALHPGLRRYEIGVNTAPTLPADRQIDLADILVGATSSRFFLRSAALGKEIVVSQGHMLSAFQAPNVCRLLLELSDDGFAPLAGFDWGALRMSPFLPRVTRGRAVLHPAQWSLTPERLGLASGKARMPDRDAFYAAVQEWRTRWGVPRHVSLMFMDNWLALDLEHPLCVDELYDEVADLEGAERLHVIIQELPGRFPHSWLRDAGGNAHLNEVVVPLLARDPGLTRRPPVPSRPARRIGHDGPSADLAAPARARSFQPGGEWTYLKLYAAAGGHDDVVSGPLRELAEGLTASGAVDRWFFLRYADPMPHLRIRFHAARPDLSASVLATALEWANSLIHDGLAGEVAVVGYDREVERYGGPDAIDAMERVFQANSEACAELLASGSELDPDVLCVLGMHALHRDWGLDPLAMVPSPAGRRIPEATRKRFRRVQRQLCEVLVPWDEHPDETARNNMNQLEGILSRQQQTLAEVGDHIRELASQNRLVGDEQQMLASLAHMHANRFLGLGQDRERLCHDLWILAAEAIRRRPASEGRA
ncbi:Nisin biosynthesis protein NisB [Streptomyces xanthochromogenes]